MLDARPVFYVIGLMIAALGAFMMAPALADFLLDDPHWRVYAFSGAFTMVIGFSTSIACHMGRKEGLTIQQTFLLTTGAWVALPVFGAIPFVLGEPNASYVDAFFEAMSGLTTTGSTVFAGLDDLPAAVKLWRGLLQWFGGVGVIVFAVAFLPMMRVGGMQYFRSEGFDTFGKILPRAAEIANSISAIYVGLTALCLMGYAAAGMNLFDAAVHAMTTIATGGFANYDASFGNFPPAVEYVSVVFMILASLPFVRYVQFVTGSAQPLFRDSQVRAFLLIVFTVVGVLAAYRALSTDLPFEPAFRRALFNGVSILTGTGYASEDYGRWGSFAVTIFFAIGLIGGCAGSTCCSVKVFRVQVLATAVATQIRRLHSPHGVFRLTYDRRPLNAEILSSVMSFFYVFAVTLGCVAVLLTMVGLDAVTAISGAATALANVGPGLGATIGPAGNFASLPESAKWILSATMLLGRLELLSVFVLFSRSFWRR